MNKIKPDDDNGNDFAIFQREKLNKKDTFVGWKRDGEINYAAECFL